MLKHTEDGANLSVEEDVIVFAIEFPGEVVHEESLSGELLSDSAARRAFGRQNVILPAEFALTEADDSFVLLILLAEA